MENTSLFLKNIRKNKIKHPNQKGFNLKDWFNEYKNCIDIDDASMEDVNVFQAGIIIESLLSNTREELSDLYKENNPFNSYTDILKSYISISNRDRNILNKNIFQTTADKTTETLNIFSITIQTYDNEVTIDDMATGCVDGIANAIFFCIKNIQNNEKLLQGSSPLSKLSFLKKEAYLSQIYHTYDNAWKAILWSNYEFRNIRHNIYEISQPNDSYQQAIIQSDQRKTKLHLQTASILYNSEKIKLFNNYFNNQKYLVKSKSFRSDQIKNASQNIQENNKLWIFNIEQLNDYFSSEMLNYKHEDKFSIVDIQTIFKHLSFLSYQYDDNYMDIDIGENDIDKLHLFCPIIKKDKLIKGIVNVTKYKYNEAQDILNFLEYKANGSQDLWANPIMSISKTEYSILTSSLMTPNIMRLVEHWFAQFEIDLGKKGFKYEQTIIETFNKIVTKNELIESFDEAISKRIKVNKNKEEEIDFLCRIGDKILLGESKSIVTVDSPISEYRTYDRLKDASEQVQRKSTFVMENLEDIFKLLNWAYEADKKYEIVGFILNSEKSFVGYNIEGVPVCDGKILNEYFTNNISPIFSAFEDGKVKHYAKFILYDNFKQMTENLKTYLYNPPQLRILSKKVKKNSMTLPILKDQKYIIYISRLITENFELNDLLEKDFPFKIEKSIDYHEKIKNAEIII